MASSSQHVSPGVFTKIVDLSEYVRSVPSTIGFIPIICKKGPDNQMVLTNRTDFLVDFGDPDITYAGRVWSQGPYVANNFLEESDSLYVIRVMPENSGYSYIALDTNGDPRTSIGTLNYLSEIRTQVGVDTASTALDSTGNPAIIFYAVGRGAYYNDFKLEIQQDTRIPTANWADDQKYVLKIYQKQETRDAMDMTDSTSTNQYQIVETFEVSFKPNALDNDGSSLWVETIINSYSRYFRCYANELRCASGTNSGTDWSLLTTVFANGTDGDLFSDISINQPNNSIASQLITQCYTGTLTSNDSSTLDVDQVLDTENYYFSLLFECYGAYSSSSAIKSAAVQLAENRGDCVAIIDNGDNSTVGSASSGALARTLTPSINTKYASIYEPFTKVYDAFTGRDIWLSPTYHLAKVIPRSDNESEIWYAPAGPNRALINEIKEFRFNPTLNQRDSMYLKQLNPIVRFNEGDMVFGQLTSQARTTALQDLNIVRLVLYVQRALEQFCRYYLFEQNDEDTWEAIATNINQFLRVIKNKRGLYSYTVDVGATDYEKKIKTVHVDVMLQPTRIVEQINLTFYIK